jgi:hypothetical protein
LFWFKNDKLCQFFAGEIILKIITSAPALCMHIVPTYVFVSVPSSKQHDERGVVDTVS